MTQLNISGGFYESKSLPVSGQQLINAFVQTPETESAYSEEVIFGTPGIILENTTGTSAANRNRGSLAINGVPYFVNGDELVSLAEDGTLSASLGTVTGAFNQRVSMAQNGTQLMILVPGGDGFIYTPETDVFTIISDVDFITAEAQYVTFNDSYFIASTNLLNGKRFIISAINDGLSWNALDFGSAEGNPDKIIAPWAFKDRLYMMGSFTFEPFRNIGGSAFPFEAIQGGLQNKGVISPFSLANGTNYFYWVGAGENEKLGIWRSDGGTPEKISTPAIDDFIQQFTLDELLGVYTIYEGLGGNTFLAFHFPPLAIVFNEINGKWHERQTDGTTHRVASVVEAYNQLYVGDIFDGRIGRIDATSGSEYDNDYVMRTLVTSPFNIDQNTFSVPVLELTMDTGENIIDEPDPVVRLSVSRDGAKTFGFEDAASLGPVGEFKRRVMWRRKGQFERTDVMKFKYASPMPMVMIRLDAKIKPLVERF